MRCGRLIAPVPIHRVSRSARPPPARPSAGAERVEREALAGLNSIMGPSARFAVTSIP
jgi:hypothetical protein